MKMQSCLKKLVPLICLAIFAGCGGGGGADNNATSAGLRMGGGIQGLPLSLTGTASTVAGASGSSDGAGGGARFDTPNDVVSDGSNLYVADTGAGTIRKIAIATGAVTTVAGSPWSIGSADGTGAAARFNNPFGLTISSDKATLYVCDSGNSTIRKVDIASGAVTTLAGAPGSIGAADGSGSSARFNFPTGITTDGTSLYVADSINNTIRKIVISTGAVTTFAGSGAAGMADGTGVAASFNNPYGITTDGTNLYVTDNGNGAVRRIVITSAMVSTLVEKDGFASPAGIATDGTSLFITDDDMNIVRKVDIATQVISNVAGDAVGGTPGAVDGTGGVARFNAPTGIAKSGSSLFITDSESGTLRQVDVATGAVSTFAGTPGSADGTGTAAGFRTPTDICTDGANLYVADAGSNTIRKIVISSGSVSTIAGTAGLSGSADGTGAAARFDSPDAITTDGTSLYVADTGNHTIRKVVISTGAVSTLAGTAGASGSADGLGPAARFDSPGGITTDGTNLYVADTGNNSIRKVVIATGAVSTIAGTAAGFKSPYGITFDGTSLYVADSGNKAVRKVTVASGAAVSLAGGFDFPVGITCDGKNLYVTDSGSRSVRKIVIASGESTTISSDFANPAGITTDGSRLYVTDADRNMVVAIR